MMAATDLAAQGSVLLVGGGTENMNDWSDAPYRWLVTHAPNRKIAVLHYTDTSTFFTSYFPWLSPCIVNNRAITSSTQANDSATYRFILEHDGIFLRGGDQAQYVSRWNGTLTQQAIREVFQRGGVVGGSSAGEMVLSDVVFTGGTTNSWSLLRAPTSSVTLVDDFLRLVTHALAESHTNERGRIGRLPVFMARYHQATGTKVIGLGVDINSALAVDANGRAEVMGGSAVALLRWKTMTTYSIEPGLPFALSDMSFDQMLPGSSVDLPTGTITPTATAVAYTPKPVECAPGPVIVDGSGNSADWVAVTGSLHALETLLSGPTDTVGVISSPASPTAATFVQGQLASWGLGSKIVWIDEARKQDPATGAAIGGVQALVFVGNRIDSAAGLLHPTTVAGAAFAVCVQSGRPIALLGDDAMLAGERALGGLTSGPYNAYYGTLVSSPALALLKGMVIVPRLFQNPDLTTSYDYTENRTMGLMWTMVTTASPVGVAIDAGAYVQFSGGSMQVGGVSTSSSPALVLDARAVVSVDVPVFKRPGRPNPVQNAALLGATMHIVRSGGTMTITSVEEGLLSVPRSPHVLMAVPNPFNPETTIRFRIGEGGGLARLSVHDILGREVAVLVEERVSSGEHAVSWNADGRSSGTYFARLVLRGPAGTTNTSLRMLLIR
jgi:cyanophycinase